MSRSVQENHGVTEFFSVKERSRCGMFWSINISFFVCHSWPECQLGIFTQYLFFADCFSSSVCVQSSAALSTSVGCRAAPGMESLLFCTLDKPGVLFLHLN